MVALQLGAEAQLALADMVWIAVSFLCHPGEYMAATEDSTPFRFQDAALWVGGQRCLNLPTATEHQIRVAMFSTLIPTRRMLFLEK